MPTDEQCAQLSSGSFALVTGAAAALVFLPFTLSALSNPAQRTEGIYFEVAAYVSGVAAAWAIWRLACRRDTVTPRTGIWVGIATALVVHLLLSFALLVPAGIDSATPLAAGLVFVWSLVLVGWLSLPLGAVVGWWMMRRAIAERARREAR